MIKITDWTGKEWAERLRDAAILLLHFLRNPVQGMLKLPDWEWPFLLACQGIAAVASGLLAGMVARSWSNMLAGIFVVPITAAIFTLVVAGFFHYTFFFFLKKEFPFKSTYTHLVFAELPILIMAILAPLLPPLILLGPLATALLLHVGFVSNFQLDRRIVTRLLGGLYLVFVAFWIYNSIQLKQSQRELREKATPATLDILEKELKGN